MLSRRLARAVFFKRPELIANEIADFSSKQKGKKVQSKKGNEKTPNKRKQFDPLYDKVVDGSSRRGSDSHLKKQRIPSYAATLLFVSCVPQSYWFYQMLWSELLSDAFFDYFQKSAQWICTQVFLEGAANSSVVMIDYGVIKNDEERKRELRKKGINQCKYHPLLIGWSLTLIDTPSVNCLLPLIIAMVHIMLKNGTLQSSNVLPKRYFMVRIFVLTYNLVLLLIMWYMGRVARKEKLNLELEFFHRIQRILIKYDQEFEGYKFDDGI